MRLTIKSAIIKPRQNPDMFILTFIVRQCHKDTSEFQGKSATDFSFDENRIRGVMSMIVVVSFCVFVV